MNSENRTSCAATHDTEDEKGRVDHGAAPVIRLRCCCCGETTRGRQWWNRDTGWGLCSKCIDYCARGETPETMKDLYGVRGVHYDVADVTSAPK